MPVRSSRLSRVLALPAVLLVALAGCGDDDDDGGDATSSGGDTYDAEQYVAALAGEIGGEGEGGACVAQALVAAIGTQRLESSGVTPEDLATSGSLEDLDLAIDQSSAPTLQADLEACPSLVDLFGEAAEASQEEIDCVRERVTQAQIAELFVVQFTGATPSQALLDAQEGTQACFDS